MSNYLAIATVSAALKQIIQEAVNVIGGAEVKFGRPENKEPSFNGVHLYLYMVRPNAGMSNRDLATRNSNGTLIQRPQSALDLYYIISFYGDESQLIPQRLMGSTICSLLAQPILTRERIKEVTDPGGLYNFLPESDLEQQIESVKFAQVYLSNEDFSKLWSIFLQVPHRLFITYQASVVLLEPQLPVEKSPPMKTPNIQTDLGAV
jgi:hypothetical protein